MRDGVGNEISYWRDWDSMDNCVDVLVIDGYGYRLNKWEISREVLLLFLCLVEKFLNKDIQYRNTFGIFQSFS